MKRYQLNNKGATLGVTIVLILFLTIIAFIVMSMSAIITSTVIKNDKNADLYLQLQQQGQNYLNDFSVIANELYIDNNVGETDYYLELETRIDDYITTNNLLDNFDFIDEHSQISFTIIDNAINKKLEVRLQARSYLDIDSIIKNPDSQVPNPFFDILSWKIFSI